MEREKSTDHDLLIELRTEMRGLREDLKRMTEANEKLNTDYETRIRNLEKVTEPLPLLRSIVYGQVAMILIAVLSAIIYSVVNKQ